jgi:hypothetical protein
MYTCCEKKLLFFSNGKIFIYDGNAVCLYFVVENARYRWGKCA